MAAVVGGARRERKKEKKRPAALRCSASVGVTRFGPSLSLSFFLSLIREGTEGRLGEGDVGEGSERAVTSELFQWRPLPLLSSPALCWGGGSARSGAVLGW